MIDIMKSMDIFQILLLGKEFLILILVFGALLAYAVVRGKQALVSLILGLYIALLISLKFPYNEAIYNLTAREGNTVPILTIIIFAVFAGISTILFEHLLSSKYKENTFESISKKVILAILGTILVMAYSYQVLPITSIIDPGSAIGTLFAPPEYFFWFLVIPLAGLFFM